MYDAYHSTLFVNKHPIFVLSMALDPEKIDVNIHPQKHDIKIEQHEQVYQAVFNSVKETLQKNNLIPIIDFDFEEQQTFGTPQKEKKETNYQFEPSNQTVFAVKEESATLSSEPVVMQEPELRQASRFPPMKLLGQVHKTFFVAETLDGMFYIDQHAAHERVLYEQFMNQYMSKEVEVQQLLQGEVLEFSPEQKALTMENLVALGEFGFELEPFGENTFVIKTIPLLFGRLQPKEVIFDVLNLLRDGKQKLLETKEEIVTRMSCRAAVMAGEVLTIGEMDKILDSLGRTELPYTCPHGRPTVIKVSVDELEKKFKRK